MSDLFGIELPNNKDKRQNIKNLRRQRRQDLRNASSREEKQTIRQNTRSAIREQRGGRTQLTELISDVKNVKEQIEDKTINTNLGRIVKAGLGLAKNVSRGNIQGIVNDAQKVYNIGGKIINPDKATANVTNILKDDGCNCPQNT